MGSKVTCVSKRQYFSEWSAQIHATHINFEINQDKFTVYKCSYYHFYLTTQ